MHNFFIFVLAIIFISGCRSGQQIYQSLPNEFSHVTHKTIAKILHVGKTTNNDILKIFKYPHSKYKSSNGDFCYKYESKKIELIGKKTLDFTSEVKYIDIDYKMCLFVFNKSGTLRYAMYNPYALGQQTKYNIIDININISDEKFHENFISLKKESSIGTIMRKLGKPENIYILGEIEILLYKNENKNNPTSHDIYQRMNNPLFELHNNNNIHTIYIIEIKNNKMINNFFMTYDNYT